MYTFLNAHLSKGPPANCPEDLKVVKGHLHGRGGVLGGGAGSGFGPVLPAKLKQVLARNASNKASVKSQKL